MNADKADLYGSKMDIVLANVESYNRDFTHSHDLALSTSDKHRRPNWKQHSPSIAYTILRR